MQKNNPFSLEGKNVIITGASSGIGRSAAVECARAGATLLLLARNKERLEATIRTLSPGNHVYNVTDLTEYEKLENSIADFTSKCGMIHGFIHAAGREMTQPLSFIKPGSYQELFSINVISGFELARILSRKKFTDPEKGASYVFISSVRAFVGQEGAIAYSASKGALTAGVRSMSLELAPKKIRVNAILPSIVRTEMTRNLFEVIPPESVKKMDESHPLGFGEPEDVAYACVYLLSDAARWMTGNNMVIDGGYSAR